MTSVLKIGHYILGKTIGVGSFGKVKIAEHEGTGHKVAVKILNREQVTNLRMDQKVRREIQVLKLFRHPHIIKLYDVIETPTDIFMVMEYVPGGELFDYIIAHGKLTDEEARRYFQQIVAAVEYCHDHMVVHRDLKPENLLLSGNGMIKLADFGLSNVMRDGDFLQTSCGSPNYAAPEVISGQLYAGPEVDVWSCGVILYTLVCARLPFDDPHIPTLFKMIREGNFTIPPYVSRKCRDLIERMLCVSLVDRITIAEIREHPWFRKRLPPYLEPRHTHAHAVHLDEDCLRELADIYARVGISRADVVAVLKRQQRLAARSAAKNPSSPPTSTSSDHAGDTEDDELRPIDDADIDERTQQQIRVAYDLIYDARQTETVPRREPPRARSTLSESAPQPDLPRPPGFSPPHSDFKDDSALSHSLRDELPFDIEAAVHRARSLTTGGPETSPAPLGAPQHEWYLGFLSLESPADIMMILFRVLQDLNFEWKVCNEYRVRVRGPVDAADLFKVKFDVQLFKVKTARYMLDLRIISPHTIPALDAASLLISRLHGEAMAIHLTTGFENASREFDNSSRDFFDVELFM